MSRAAEAPVLEAPVLEVEGLTVSFRERGSNRRLVALADVDLTVAAAESVALVGARAPASRRSRGR